MTLDQDKLTASAKGFRALFFNELRRDPGLWSQFAMNVPCEGQSNEYDWLGGPPSVEEWASGNRPMGSLKAYNYEINDKIWANGLRVKRKHIEDDKLGLYAPVIRMMAMDFDLKKTKRVFADLFLSGFAGTIQTAYDGQFFFDSDHLDNEETAQSNKATAALSAAALETALETMMQYTDDRGEKLDVFPTHLVVPPQLRATALRILGRGIVDENSAGVTNINNGVVQLIVAPWLAAQAAYWFLVDLSKMLKPFIFQPRIPVDFQALINPQDPNVFNADQYYYGGRERFNISYGAWQLAYGSDGTT